MVTLTFYGGVAQIGGNKILVEDRDAKLWLDMGAPFDLGSAYFGAEFLQPRDRFGLRDYFALDLIPEIRGLYSEKVLAPTGLRWSPSDYAGIFISHVHFDHTNHLRFVDESIPVHLGAGTLTILESWGETTPTMSIGDEHPFVPFHTGDRIDADGIEVEPIHVDHSAPAAYGHLVHTSEGTIAYTGDLRKHGPEGRLTEDFIAAAERARPIALIVEGTRVAPDDRREDMSEADVKTRAIRIVEESKGKLPLVTFPGRDVDRMRTFSEVALATGRKFVINAKTAHLLITMQKDTHIRVPDVLTQDEILLYDRRLKATPGWERTVQGMMKDKVVTGADLHAKPADYLVQLDFYHLTELIDIRPPPGSPFIHSKSEAFDEEDINEEVLTNWLSRFGLDRKQVHASGHLSEREIEAMIRRIGARTVYPVHTEHPGRFTAFARRVIEPVKYEPMTVPG